MTRKEQENAHKIDPNLAQETNDNTKHLIADGFRRFSFGLHEYKGGNKGSDLVFYGEDDDPKDLDQGNAILPPPSLAPLPDERLQLKEQVNYLKDKNQELENKNAKLEGELSAYKQILNILSKEHQDEN